jgi:protein involved in polysaccharide export with SLBB domain
VQLIARAGGLADHAKQKHVYVLRQSTGSRVNIDYKDVIQGRRGSRDVELLPGDTVVVP